MSRAALGTAALLALACTALYASTARGVFVFGDDVLVYQVTEAIVERGSVAVSSPNLRGVVARSVQGADGELYSKYGLGLSLVAAPFYAASGPVFDRLELPETRDAEGNLRTGAPIFGTSLAVAIAAGATVGVTFLLALELGLPALAALATSTLLGAGTLLAHYASTFLSEPLAALCLAVALLGFARADRGARGSTGALATSGFFSGLMVATKVAHLVAVAPIAIGAVWLALRRPGPRWRPFAAWSAPFVFWLVAVALFDLTRFGSVFETGYGEEARRFATPLAIGLVGLLISPGKGILWYCPLLALAPFGTGDLWRRRPAVAAVGAASCASLAVVAAKFYQWWGGDCWGPRLLVPLLPLAVLPAGFVLARWKRLGVAARVGIAALLAASLVVGGLPLLVPFDGYAERLSADPGRLHESIWSPRDSPLVTAAVALPGAVAQTWGRLTGRTPFTSDDGAPRYPDAAFVRYGSHALLQWTRAGLALALIFGGCAFVAARRIDQKALLSRPPQYRPAALS